MCAGKDNIQDHNENDNHLLASYPTSSFSSNYIFATREMTNDCIDKESILGQAQSNTWFISNSLFVIHDNTEDHIGNKFFL